MYKVIVKNDQSETIVHNGNRPSDQIRIVGGQVKKAINSIDTFAFYIYPDNPGYDNLKSLITKVSVTDLQSQKQIFNGRVLTIKDSMDNHGQIFKNVTCEGRLGWLYDSVQPYGTYKVSSPQTTLTSFLNQHNSQVGDDKRIDVGMVTVTGGNDYEYATNWTSTMETISEKLIDKFGGEIQLRDGDDGKVYLDYLDRIGRGTDTKIELAVNLKSITRTVDETAVITRLYPLGAKIGNTESRLRITSVNDGKPYIEDDELVAKYGVISGVEIWDDVTVADNLLSKGKKHLAETNKVKKQFEITALDLSKIGLDFETFELGNQHRVVNPLMGIDETVRIIGITINLDDIGASALTFGDKFETMTGFTVKKSKSAEQKIEESNIRTSSIINEKIENATRLITGADGGHVILDPSEKPSRILIMDTADIETCTSCIQLNRNGIGFWNKEKDGGSAKTGPYKNAWTIDGNLVASFITALTLTGQRINNGDGAFKVDEDGNVVMKSAVITNGNINCGNGIFTVDKDGNVSANSFCSSSAKITGGSVNISTDSESNDIINLACGDWRMELSPLQWVLTNNKDNTKFFCQAGMLAAERNGKVAAALSAHNNMFNLYDSSGNLSMNLDADNNMFKLYDSSGKLMACVDGKNGVVWARNKITTEPY